MKTENKLKAQKAQTHQSHINWIPSKQCLRKRSSKTSNAPTTNPQNPHLQDAKIDPTKKVRIIPSHICMLQFTVFILVEQERKNKTKQKPQNKTKTKLKHENVRVTE